MTAEASLNSIPVQLLGALELHLSKHGALQEPAAIDKGFGDVCQRPD